MPKAKSKRKAQKIIEPRILVLEGLYADTSQIIDVAGGVGVEESPWQMKAVQRKLKSGNIDGMLLTGGTDVNPYYYGEAMCPLTQNPDHKRDEVEMWALDYCRDHKIPVLGICRGSQIMNVSRGGTLCQDIEEYLGRDFDDLHHNGTTHFVHPEKRSTTLKRIIGPDGCMTAMSLHHQCVLDPGEGMRIAARAWDDTPEAIESKDGLWLGVQFHPEMDAMRDETCFNIFRWLIETAAFRKGGRAKAVRFQDAVDEYYEAVKTSYDTWKDDYRKDCELCGGDCAYGECILDDGDAYNLREHGDYEYEKWWKDHENSGKSASNPGGRAKRKSRKAGEASIPSMREATTDEVITLLTDELGGVIITDKSGNVIDSTCEELDAEDKAVPFDCSSYPVNGTLNQLNAGPPAPDWLPRWAATWGEDADGEQWCAGTGSQAKFYYRNGHLHYDGVKGLAPLPLDTPRNLRPKCARCQVTFDNDEDYEMHLRYIHPHHGQGRGEHHRLSTEELDIMHDAAERAARDDDPSDFAPYTK